ncbi:MAG: hypothetical protein Q4D44_02730 [Eubacteriales bacterium]|nr:hypothetical protein [Eubacteriales bacterium]
MRNLKKILSVTLVMLMVLSLGACSSVPKTLSEQWSYKTAYAEYDAGVYLFALFTAYDRAYGIISDAEGDDFDSEASIMDVRSTFDETDEVFVCRDWIVKEADTITRNLIAMDLALEKYGIELDPQVVENAREQAKIDWYLGPYYFDYGPEYSTPYESVFGKFGISFDSYFLSSVNLANVKQEALFSHLYGKGGEMEVSEKDVEKYFADNYTSYSYFTLPLFTTTMDESGSNVQVPLKDSELGVVKEVLTAYTKLINEENASFEQVVESYKKYAKITDDPSTDSIEDLSRNTSLPQEVIDKLESMKDNKASVVYTGEDNSQVAYFVCKHTLADSADDYLGDEVNRNQILKSMKGEDFYDYLMALTDAVECQVNTGYIEKCDPKMFEEK